MILQYSPASIDDLINIGNFIKPHNPGRAESFVEELKKCCELLLDQPKKGRDRSELRPNLRYLPHEKYLIFYEPFDDRILIVRVLHSAQDVNSIMDSN